MAQEVPEGRGEGRARGVCGGEGTRCGAEMPRTELTEQGVRRHAASECVGRRRRAGAGGRSAVIGAPFADVTKMRWLRELHQTTSELG